MAIPITVPRLGWNMEEGVFHGWLKKEGDPVRPGDALFSLEAEKSTQDIESMDSGVLRLIPEGPKEGDTVVVGAVIGYLTGPGEETLGARSAGAHKVPEPSPASPAARAPAERAPYRPIASPALAGRRASWASIGRTLRGVDATAESVSGTCGPPRSIRRSRKELELPSAPCAGRSPSA